ncbi:6-hydroxymethylpterin diphosphokinase MptE-like protein [Methanocorpusculum vombati]|uniref:6-hydroxymethyl-7,8-dihydropterin pyrophosphokinase n=1 Tax=Methanocorpusculum vombati TaxID=3002864 RepID=A0ABT4IL49_9EURY|nr:6-hydroxymethylpterin diphosphokinase MptE-like protein [Methanocorpusculum vombati]MCZ9320022.1 DUF115 domain-containing protein [Methanocorpusculum sp.]MCZ0861957.1 DUF115 domain-containing protein [Methanocorpusculum vombati]MDE2520077.1 DUF115 domain-containing protein [Methanocorpusculum sp.]MDE2535256.1 DUF115 domain-containing protein [Methanocorpusculum sp.]MDE2545803.1 DUF115 domain-containing protein [Methanocorpusculum sp.]
MKAEEWEPYYSEILDFFGFSREDDERAAQILAELLPRDDIAKLRDAVWGRDCIVCGNAPSLAAEIRSTDFSGKVIIAADAAARVLLHAGHRPEVILSDIDGMDDDFLAMNDQGTILVLHAHGDNIPLVRSWVPKVRGPVVGTTQATPLAHVYNFGGFSDGDRCVFCAYELGAAHVTLIGFDLDDRSVDPVKHGKLMIARKLLKLLGHDV